MIKLSADEVAARAPTPTESHAGWAAQQETRLPAWVRRGTLLGPSPRRSGKYAGSQRFWARTPTRQGEVGNKQSVPWGTFSSPVGRAWTCRRLRLVTVNMK